MLGIYVYMSSPTIGGAPIGAEFRRISTPHMCTPEYDVYLCEKCPYIISIYTYRRTSDPDVHSSILTGHLRAVHPVIFCRACFVLLFFFLYIFSSFFCFFFLFFIFFLMYSLSQNNKLEQLVSEMKGAPQSAAQVRAGWMEV